MHLTRYCPFRTGISGGFYSLLPLDRFPVPGREGGGGGAKGQPVLLSHHPLNPRPIQGVQEVRL
jgi:hypothetical protein